MTDVLDAPRRFRIPTDVQRAMFCERHAKRAYADGRIGEALWWEERRDYWLRRP